MVTDRGSEVSPISNPLIERGSMACLLAINRSVGRVLSREARKKENNVASVGRGRAGEAGAAVKLKIKIYDCIKRLKRDTGCAKGNFRNNADTEQRHE